MNDEISTEDSRLSVTSLTPEQARDASLILAGHAADAVELAEWMECCGLRPYQPGGDRTLWGRHTKLRETS